MLEHGAWADGSSWDGVIGLLQADGYPVYAPPNPLRGLANDSATLADFLKTLTGPVILVGHSYGGMVITNAATGNPNVKALVYIDAFIPAQGETAFGLTAAQPGILRGLGQCLPRRALPRGPGGRFRHLPQDRPRPALPGIRPVLRQRPAGQPGRDAGRHPAPHSVQRRDQPPPEFPAWQTIPSWSLIGTADHVIPPAEQLFMSQRAHARITEINAGHLSLISHPGAVTRVIIAAAQATG